MHKLTVISAVSLCNIINKKLPKPPMAKLDYHKREQSASGGFQQWELNTVATEARVPMELLR